MIKDYKAYQDELTKIEKDFMDKSTIDDEVILSEAFYEEQADKILLETYKAKKLRLHYTLFISLSLFLGRMNWFEVSGGTFT